MKAIPHILMWELWKRRNAKRHDKEISFNKMYSQCLLTVHQLYRPTLYFHIVKWSVPEERWFKYNTDGASKGNLGKAPMVFVLEITRETWFTQKHRT
ncbi:hypothetical protein H5410_004883 [Solanum commersonii]|uniref:Uncharacterized protein n=1 Tax=Solanum commersonii TaxID=4109 RepID=A0A9J6A537_SOLCO|nr:hypothetical protein H5410_004883 [Solanum commersonii]